MVNHGKPAINGPFSAILCHQKTLAVRAPGKKRPLRATDGARSAPLRAGTDSWNASGGGGIQ